MLKPIIPIIVAAIFFSSCASRKNIVYFQDVDSGQSDSLTFAEPILKVDDLLSINVTAADMMVTMPFNNPGMIDQTETSMQNRTVSEGYLIDSNGSIEFPVLGSLKLAGLTKSQAEKLIEDELSKLIINPSVSIRLLNFKFTVLGDVSRPGTYTSQGNRTSILEAIGMAGDLAITGVRNNVTIIRETEGERRIATIDLLNLKSISQEYYYIQQNDVIYVEPNNAKIQTSANIRNIGTFLSVASLALTLIVILTR